MRRWSGLAALFAGALSLGTVITVGATVTQAGAQNSATSNTCQGTVSALTVGIAATPDDGGYWVADYNGNVIPCGDAAAFPPLSFRPNGLIVGIAPTTDGGGYYLVASDGGVFAFGDAHFQGSMGGQRLNKPILGIAVDPATGGYWLVAGDGGIFAFDAPFYGSTGNIHLNEPVIGMAAANHGSGYYLVATDGGVFAYNAPFLGSTGGMGIEAPIVGMATDATTGGYWLVGADGGLFSYGAPFYGSGVGSVSPLFEVTAMEAKQAGSGYRMVDDYGEVYAFGTSGNFGSPRATVPLVSPPDPPAILP